MDPEVEVMVNRVLELLEQGMSLAGALLQALEEDDALVVTL